MKAPTLSAALVALCVLASPAFAATPTLTVQLGQPPGFVATDVATFDDSPLANSFCCVSTQTGFTTHGLTFRGATGGPTSGFWGQRMFQGDGSSSCYFNGGGLDVLSITRADDAPFDALQLQVSSGWEGWVPVIPVWIRALLNGQVVADFDVDVPAGQYVTVTGGGFDQVWVGAYYDPEGRDLHDPTAFQALAVDNVAYGTVAVTAPPPPATFVFTGFFPPVGNVPVRNSVNAGAAVPVKFSLGGDQGLQIFAESFPASETMDCDASTPSDVVEPTLNAGGSSLSYDPVTEVYTYVWKTNKAWAGTCRELIVKLTDGKEYRAVFQLKR